MVQDSLLAKRRLFSTWSSGIISRVPALNAQFHSIDDEIVGQFPNNVGSGLESFPPFRCDLPVNKYPISSRPYSLTGLDSESYPCRVIDPKSVSRINDTELMDSDSIQVEYCLFDDLLQPLFHALYRAAAASVRPRYALQSVYGRRREGCEFLIIGNRKGQDGAGRCLPSTQGVLPGVGIEADSSKAPAYIPSRPRGYCNKGKQKPSY